MIIPIIILVLCINSVTAGEEQCAPCLWNGQQFSCGAIAWFTSHYHACCNGAWCTCTAGYPNGPCGCCGLFAEQNTTKDDKIIVSGAILDDKYILSEDGNLYTEYVTLAEKKLNEDTYVVGKTIHSSKLKQDDMILWPGYDIDSSLSKIDNVVIKIEHYNVSADNYKCCPRMRQGITCIWLGCCGGICCC